MPLVCISCSLRALLDGVPAPTFDETPEAHLARVHPNPYETYRERQMMEAELYKRGLLPDDPPTP